MNPPFQDNPIYFGCWSPTSAGHYFYSPCARRVSEEPRALPWLLKDIDGGLCPRVEIEPGRFLRDEPQSLAAIHTREGWTALAMWDRTADSRGGSNSVFFVRGEFSFHELEQAIAAAFLGVWQRINQAAPVRLYGTQLVARSLDSKWYADRPVDGAGGFDKRSLRNIK